MDKFIYGILATSFVFTSFLLWSGSRLSAASRLYGMALRFARALCRYLEYRQKVTAIGDAAMAEAARLHKAERQNWQEVADGQ